MDLAHPSPSRGLEASWRRFGRVPALASGSDSPEPGIACAIDVQGPLQRGEMAA